MSIEFWATVNGAAMLSFIGLLIRTESRITKLETVIQIMRGKE